MNNNEILARIKNIEKELNEMKNILEVPEERSKFLLTKVTEKSDNPEDFDIFDGILYEYLGDSEAVTIPDGVTKIGKEAFYQNRTVTKITLPETVTEIEEYAFSDCINLEEVKISGNSLTAGRYSFSGCKRLSGIDIEKIKIVSSNAFFGCKSLKRLIFSENTEIIGEFAFSGCTELSISVPVTCKRGYCAFYGCKSVEIKKGGQNYEL